MATVHPFHAMRYRSDIDLERVVAPPYDVISPTKKKELLELHENNFVRVTLGLEADGDSSADNRYTRAGSELHDWISEGTLVRDPDALMFIYRTDYGVPASSSAGVVCTVELEPLGEGSILPHENTMPGPKRDRLEMMRATEANLEPLWFAADRSIGPILDLMTRAENEPPLLDVTSDEVRHRIWPLEESAEAEFTENLSGGSLVVADGHHRYETAVTYRDEKRLTNGSGPWDSTLALIQDPEVATPDLRAIHRIVEGVSFAEIEKLVKIDNLPENIPESLEGVIEATREGGYIGVIGEEGAGLIASEGDLDTAFLAEAILGPLGAPTTYEHDIGELRTAIFEGSVVFIVAPIDVMRVVELATAGVRTPPKTTLFWPKPLSGLLLRDLAQRGVSRRGTPALR